VSHSVKTLCLASVLMVVLCMAWWLLPKHGAPHPAPSAWGPLLLLEDALTEYARDHGCLPVCASETVDYVLTDEQYKAVVECLDNAGPGAKHNRTGKTYLLHVQEGGRFPDRWGGDLCLVYDADGDGKINGSLINGTGDVELKRNSFVIWSTGADREQEIPFTNRMEGKNADNVLLVR